MNRVIDRIDIAGKKFGKLTAISCADSDSRGRFFWICQCDCGGTARVIRYSLECGNTKSCGCLTWRHGKTKSKAHKAWVEMRARVLKTNNCRYSDYGGRGIKVCDSWLSFINFYNDMGDPPTPKHSLDRIDVNGNYEPSNCRWATQKEQQRNKRTTRWVTFQGRKMSLAEAVEIVGMTVRLVHQRIFRDGLSVDEALKKGSRRKRSENPHLFGSQKKAG